MKSLSPIKVDDYAEKTEELEVLNEKLKSYPRT